LLHAVVNFICIFFFFFSFVVPHLMLPEAPQPYGLLYYPPYWTFQLSPPFPRYHAPLSRESWSCNPVTYVSNFRHYSSSREILAAKVGTMWRREMAGKFSLKMPDFHVAFSDLLYTIHLRHGTDSFTSLPKKGVLWIFFSP
jgi:hypothetical protein